MANAFFMQCEIDQGVERVYLSNCPLWCDHHLPTEPFTLDFNDFTDDGAGAIAETDTVTDSLGNVWGFRNGTDPTWFVADKGFVACPDSVQFVEPRNSSLEALILEPIEDNLGNRFPHPPHFNGQYPWSILWEGVSGITPQGSIQWLSTSSPVYGEEHLCGHTVFSTLVGNGNVPGGAIEFREGKSDLCDTMGATLITPDIISDVALGNCCMCYLLRVNPCEHEIDKIVRITLDDTATNECEVSWYNATTQTNFDDHPFEKRFELNCDDWWITDIADPTARGTYQPDPLVENPEAIYPPDLLMMYNPNQQMSFNFTGNGGLNGPLDIAVGRFILRDDFMSDGVFDLNCPPRP